LGKKSLSRWNGNGQAQEVLGMFVKVLTNLISRKSASAKFYINTKIVIQEDGAGATVLSDWFDGRGTTKLNLIMQYLFSLQQKRFYFISSCYICTVIDIYDWQIHMVAFKIAKFSGEESMYSLLYNIMLQPFNNYGRLRVIWGCWS